MSVEIPLKYKYRCSKPRGRNRADYNGNSGKHRHKGTLSPVGISTRTRRVVRRRKRK